MASPQAENRNEVGCKYITYIHICQKYNVFFFFCMGVGVRVSGVFVFVCGVLDCGV